MAAEVRTIDGDMTKHDNGTGLFVRDGNLKITNSPVEQNGHTIAVYAPGRWISAVISTD